MTVGTHAMQSYAVATVRGPGPFVARSVAGACAASAIGKPLTARLDNAVVMTSTDPYGIPLTTVAVPPNPPVGLTMPFTINTVGGHGIIVFNERIDNSDGSTTLTAAHMYMQGPIAMGNMTIGQVRCGRVTKPT